MASILLGDNNGNVAGFAWVQKASRSARYSLFTFHSIFVSIYLSQSGRASHSDQRLSR
jgi:hypothetical protein